MQFLVKHDIFGQFLTCVIVLGWCTQDGNKSAFKDVKVWVALEFVPPYDIKGAFQHDTYYKYGAFLRITSGLQI